MRLEKLPIMASAQQRRAVLPDFDGSSAEAAAAVAVMDVHSRSVSDRPAHTGSKAPLRLVLLNLTPAQQACFSEVFATVRGLPLLEGLYMPSCESLDCYQSLRRDLAARMYPSSSSHLTLSSVLSIVRGTPGFASVSPATLAAALIQEKLDGAEAWVGAPVGKLHKWPVRACYWDFFIAKTMFSVCTPAAEILHRNLVIAARDLRVQPVRVAGHRCIFRLVLEYEMLLRDSDVVFVPKRAVDWLVHLFADVTNLKSLRWACLADGLDCLSVPLEHAPVTFIPWSARLLAGLHGDSDLNFKDPDVLHEISGIADHYAWMFVATCHHARPGSVELHTAASREWRSIEILCPP